MMASSIPTRPLGKTGYNVTLFGLGGEGVLRTYDEDAAAAKVISRALDLGVNYCDTAPAYAGSLDYYGATLGERRKQVFLASKTHERSRDGSLRLLDISLKRLRTDHLDLWQLHDLRSMQELDIIFGKGGALEALLQARLEGRVRFLGLTGHHDPAVLIEAMRRFKFDTVLVALNAADIHRLSFIQSVLPAADRHGTAAIGMKVCAQGALLGPGKLSMSEAIGYVLSLPVVSHVIVGCRTPEEVEQNVATVRAYKTLTDEKLRELEARTRAGHEQFAYYKRR